MSEGYDEIDKDELVMSPMRKVLVIIFVQNEQKIIPKQQKDYSRTQCAKINISKWLACMK